MFQTGNCLYDYRNKLLSGLPKNVTMWCPPYRNYTVFVVSSLLVPPIYPNFGSGEKSHAFANRVALDPSNPAIFLLPLKLFEFY